MSTPSTAGVPHIESIRKTLTVEASAQHAFDVFTGNFGNWWPLLTHHIAKVPAETAIIEPHTGGRWYERGEDGSECEWGKVLVWDPPGRLVMAWQVGGDWQYHADLITEVEVRFVPEGTDKTRVEFEHRKLEAFGEMAGAIRTALVSGWPGILERFVTAAGSNTY